MTAAAKDWYAENISGISERRSGGWEVEEEEDEVRKGKREAEDEGTAWCASSTTDSPAMFAIPSWRFKVLAAMPPTNLDALLTLAASESEYLIIQCKLYKL